MQYVEIRKFVLKALTKYAKKDIITNRERKRVPNGGDFMYINLINALKNKGISNTAAAATIEMPEPTFRSKISGRSQCGFTIDEAFKIKDNLFPEMDLTYLFANV